MSFGLGGSQTSKVPESGAGGFLGSLLGSLSQVNQMRNQATMQKLQIGEAQKAAANQQLAQLANEANSKPGLLTDPKYIAKIKQLSDVTGVIDPTKMVPGTPAIGGVPNSGQFGTSDTTDTQQGGTGGTPGTMAKESVDLAAIAPTPGFNTFDLKTKQWLAGLQPADRAATLEGVPGVPPKFLTMGASTTPIEVRAIHEDMRDVADKLGSGTLTGPAGVAELQGIAQRAHDANIDLDPLINEFMTEAATGPKTAAQIATFNANNSDKKAQEAYRVMLTSTLPKKWAEQLRQGSEKLDQGEQGLAIKQQTANAGDVRANATMMRSQTDAVTAVTRANAAKETADARVQSVQAAMQSNNIRYTQMGLAALNTSATLLNREYQTVSDSISKIVTGGNMPSADLLAQQAAIKASLDKAIQTKEDATNFITAGPQNNLNSSMGTSSANGSAVLGDTSGGGNQLIYANGQPFNLNMGGGNQPQGQPPPPQLPGGQPQQQQPQQVAAQPGAAKVGSDPTGQYKDLANKYNQMSQAEKTTFMQGLHKSDPKKADYLATLPRSMSPKDVESAVPQAKIALSTVNPTTNKPYSTQEITQFLVQDKHYTPQQAQHIIAAARMQPAPASAAPAPAAPAQQGATDAMGVPIPQQGRNEAPPPAQQNAVQPQGKTDPWAATKQVQTQFAGQGGTWLDKLGGALSRQSGATPPVGPNAAPAPPEKPNTETPEAQGALAKAALPAVVQELTNGVPITKVLMDMQAHGITHETAMKVLQQIHQSTINQRQKTGGSQAVNPKVSQPSNQQSSQLPRGILGAIETAESARDTNKNQSSFGAEGPFQFMPQTAARYGVTDPHNVVQAARGAARYLSDLGTEFHHDWAKAIASYNWGEGNVERVSKQYGADWYKHLPPETSNYLAEVIGGMQ
jgi:hypothetical protein